MAVGLVGVLLMIDLISSNMQRKFMTRRLLISVLLVKSPSIANHLSNYI
jgi:hypothetical protein